MTNLGIEGFAGRGGGQACWALWAPLIKKCAILASAKSLDQQKCDERSAMLRGDMPVFVSGSGRCGAAGAQSIASGVNFTGPQGLVAGVVDGSGKQSD
ncbi:hypothetical protein EXN22_07785 [Pseudomonas tructae]|uniref:Uncharacterized protein n=1 Tax=Pseudomonas tructae TaxID=2518644 RepID=A0A411MFY6_9PSED|nr:hypothetical protein EXN22_07785 [Pseudomonas tructae]